MIITDAVIQDVRLRWLERTDADALRAIDEVLRRGVATPAGPAIIYRLGSRHLRVLRGVATKAFVKGQRRVRSLARAARLDGRERAHWRKR